MVSDRKVVGGVGERGQIRGNREKWVSRGRGKR